jgi:hypothetical protein
MRFGSPYQAGAIVSNPSRLLVTQAAAPFVGGASAANVDVSAFTGVFLTLDASGPTPGDQAFLTPAWFATDGSTIGATPTTFTIPGPTQLVVAVGAGAIPQTLLVYLRALGPILNLNRGTSGAALLSYRVWGTSQQLDADGPFTPGRQGTILGNFSDVLGAGGVAIHALPPHCGPVFVACYGAAGGGAGPCSAEITASGTGFGGTTSSPPGGVSVTPTEVPLWMPPQPGQVVVRNGGTAQSVATAIVCA